jgi:putative phage-type endonuclease
MDKFTPAKINQAELIGDFEAQSELWHLYRANGIGGSEIGAVLGLSPFSSAYRVWALKTKQVPEPHIDNWAVRLGKAFEQPILDLWQEQYPEWEVMLTGMYRHSEHKFAIANPDAIARHRETGELMILEVKTSRNYWSDGVPPHYLAQVQWYMAILGINKARIIAVAGWDWQDIEVPEDKFEQEVMFATGARLWQAVELNQEPEWDGSRVTYETVREMHPDIEDVEADLGELGVNLVAAQIEYERAEEKLNSYKSATLAAMGRARWGVGSYEGQESRIVAVRKARGKGNPWLEVRKG